MDVFLLFLPIMKNKKWMLVILAALILVGVNVYNHFYRTKVVVLQETTHYEDRAKGNVFFLFQEQVIAGNDAFTPDGQYIHQKVRGDTVIGTLSRPIETDEQGFPIDVEYGFEIAVKDNRLPRWVQEYANHLENQQAFPTLEDGRPWFNYTDGQVITNTSGIFISGIDGFEGITPINMEQVNTDQMWALTHMKDVTKDPSHYKLVDNLSYGMLVTTEVPVEERDSLDIEIDGKRMTGSVVKQQAVDGKSFLQLLVHDRFEHVYNKRASEGVLILREFNAFVLPESALTERNGKPGVMVKGNDALAAFVPLTDYAIDDNTLYVRVLADELKYYDVVFTHPNAIQEGDFIE